MEKSLASLYQTLQKLVGLHRQLLEAVRAEKEALLNMSLKEIQESTFTKEALLSQIQNAESERLKRLGELALHLKKPASELSLQNIILIVQGTDAKTSEQLRTSFNALNILIGRIREQNKENSKLVENSLGHIREMKKNVLGEATPHSDTYGQKGQKINAGGSSRLISGEA